MLHRRDLAPLDNLELLSQSPNLTLESYRALGRNAARRVLGLEAEPIPVRIDNTARLKHIVTTTLLHRREVEAVVEGAPPVELELFDVARIQTAKKCFDTTTACLDESDSQFSPRPEMFTTAQHVAHVAQGIDILVEGAFGSQGFDTDVEAQRTRILNITSLIESRAWLDQAMNRAVEVINSKSSEELTDPLPIDGFLGGEPRMTIVDWIVEHTAHHRGALAVYARLQGKAPSVAYE